MEKVKLTRDQRQTVKNFMNNGNILKLTVNELDKVIDGEYEVESEFKVGDWVLDVYEGITRIDSKEKEGLWIGEGTLTWVNYDGECYERLRHATPDEIAEEKQRRWWAKHGREVWELKLNDEIRHKESDGRFDVVHIFDNGDINMERTSTNDYKQKEVVTVKRPYISNYYYEVVCFAADRKDVKE